MIILKADCLILKNAAGEGVPYTADKITVELLGETAAIFDQEFIKQAAGAVLQYFRDELGRQSVTIADFTLALEKVLRGFKIAAAVKPDYSEPAPRVVQYDLAGLVTEADRGCELIFFPRLRDELRIQLRLSPQMLCFQGIHQCVMQLAGARRWSQRCQALHDQIVEFLRSCLSRETPAASCALVVK